MLERLKMLGMDENNMKLEELQKVLSLFNEEPTELEMMIVSRLKELVITRYPNEQGTYQMAHFEVTIKLE